ncbi:MAG: HD domain-containing protein [Candidatus Woesearchaeota archaeon]|nr:HD domain-containing protein [Candidatus Woesearchaeota archaeon]
MAENIENEFKKLHDIFILKEINRTGKVKNRFESSAEHSWSCMILAQYFLPKIKHRIDEKKIMRMLLYHDVIEIESGDTIVFDSDKVLGQREKEHSSLSGMKKRMPKGLADDFSVLWLEFEENKTIEAKFCQAIDKLDPVIHAIFDEDDWKYNSINEEKLRKAKQQYFEPFPEMMEFFESLVSFAKKKHYF